LLSRLDKVLSNLGLGSRKEVTEAIRRGLVTVDNEVCRVPDKKIDPEASEITFQGEKLVYRQYDYIMMNKPAGYISATEDRNKVTVIELLPDRLKRLGLFPAGRLDRDSEGLLLLTNDGNAAHAIISPKRNIDKLYYIRYSGVLSDNAEMLFSLGIEIDGGEKCLPAALERVGNGEAHVTIHEGKYHQVKRMISAVGGEVIYLKRLKIGMIELDDSLAPGEIRRLTTDEEKWIRGIIEKR
jgi:16S rRNA pseudouridine516 synthase